jgi:hypothetical protein
MAWQVDQVAAVNAIANIRKRMRHIGASAGNQRTDSYSKIDHYEIQIGSEG